MKLIKLSDDHYIVVDDSEIKDGDSCYDYYTKSIQQSTPNVNDGNAEEYFKKITQSTLPLYFLLEENYFTTLNLKPDWSKVKELPLSEVEEIINGYSVEKLAEKQHPISMEQFGKEKIDGNAYFRSIWKQGFKAHQELTKDKLHKTLSDFYVFATNGEVCKHEVITEFLLPKTEWYCEIDEQGKIKLI